VTRVNHDPDGRFPNGVPNPLLPENHAATGDHVRAHAADLGVAWDGDFDRCFFFDEAGAFVAGEHAVALIARTVLEGEPGARIVHDPRVVRNTDRIVRAGGGTPILARTGHAYMKTAMRAHDAAYGGEMSAHHYFRDFMYCDSGMIPMLMVLSLLSRTGQTLGGLVEEMRTRYPSSGELNFRVPDTRRAMEAIEERYGRGARVSHPDGLCVETDAWRFNLRASNTEPLIRLNVETQGDPQLLKDLVDRLSADIGARL
jgi:phosphomannomutase